MGCPSGLDWRETVLGQQEQIAIGDSVKMARPGTWAAALLLASALGASALSAAPAEPNCRAIESINARLSCYDAAFPPKAKKPAETAIDSSSGYKDPFLAEEERTAAKLKNICRGC
ncbi:type VI secretion protein [Bradyrhizobium manausense]|uniref:type VI secretion protein n=1 Tax=Bradyrhizobium manausense TaxID=989370 RepID=UPI0020125433|nr:type VI secretion protein [Bradyrhizobium manausense]